MHRLYTYVVLAFIYINCKAQSLSCESNIDFEDGSASGWLSTGEFSTSLYFQNCCYSSSGDVLPTDAGMPNDAYTHFPVTAPNGSMFSVKIGSFNTAPGNVKESALQRQINITPDNFLFTYNYSIALNSCFNFPASGSAAALICFLAQNGDTIPCSKQYFNSSDGHVNGFMTDSLIFSLDVAGGILYSLPWQTKTLDLSAYIGQYVTPTFMVKSCDGGNHKALMYLDVVCNSQPKQTNFCEGPGIICAPSNCASYNWSTPSGNGFTSQCIPSQQVGLYSVKVPAQKGCLSDTSVFTYKIVRKPVANFTFQTSCRSLDYSFHDLSAIGTDTVCHRRWQIQNDVMAFSDFNYHFNTAGTYSVSLIVSDCSNTCLDTAVKTITVTPPLTAAFTVVPKSCVGNPVVITNTSSTGNFPAYDWDLGFTQSAALNPIVRYDSSGTYPIKLVVQDASGCKDSVIKQIVIHSIPKIKIIPENICYGTVSHLKGNSIGTIPVSQWQWDFQNDGIIDAYSQNAQTIYNSQGLFWVKLLGISIDSCVAKDSSLVQVYPLPNASFNINRESSPEIKFTNTSTTPGNSTLMSGLWDFGEGVPQNNMAPAVVHNYEQPGVYRVFLTVTNNYECVDTVSSSLIIGSAFGIYVPNAFTPGNDGLNDLFKAESFGITAFELRVYDRWGELIFMSNDKDKGWDGKTKHGNPCKQEVYVWQINCSDVLKEDHYLLGHVTLIR